MQSFQGFVVDKGQEPSIKELNLSDLAEGEVIIRVHYSSFNYKDGLATLPNGQVVRKYPLVPGVDLAGEVVSSTDNRFKAGDKVLATSYDLGVSHDGGFAEYARVKADWVVPLPDGLSLRESMLYGTAGFTAALAIHRLEQNNLQPVNGTVLVTGATGGVGSLAILMLAKLGYTVAASTGKSSEQAYLGSLGASEILSREEVAAESNRPLEKERWAGSIDSVGGNTLTYLTRTTKTGGSIASCGLTGGSVLNATVFPFILRGISLLGIDSATCPMPLRQSIWQRLATDFKPNNLELAFAREITLNDIPQAAQEILAGQVRGRIIVRLLSEV